MNDLPKLSTEDAKAFARREMTYEDLTQEQVDEFLALKGVEPGSIDFSAVQAVVDAIDEQLSRRKESDRALEALEAEFSTPVYRAVSTLPMHALGEVEFWTYLAVRFFWKFIQRRQRSSLPFAKPTRAKDAAKSEEAAPEKLPIARYLIGKDHYQIPLRMFLRAQAVDRGDDFVAAHPIENGTDFWRSHVLGVRTSAYRPWARAVVAAQSEFELDTEAARSSAKRINRIRANVSMALHDDEEAAAIVEPLWRAK